MNSLSNPTVSAEEIREGIRNLCTKYPESYWRKIDGERRYPEDFVKALTEGGWLSVLIPEEYGGQGMGVAEASVILEEINRSGGFAGPAHAQMYTMGALLRHGSKEQKEKWLPSIASGRLRLQAFGITEPNAGSDTTSITTFAEKRGNAYYVRGRKIFISRVNHSDLMLLLVRTTPKEKSMKKTDGMSVLIVDLQKELQKGTIHLEPIQTMINHETNEVFLDEVFVPVDHRIGEEGQGFKYIMSGMNAERILIASEALGDGKYFVDRSAEYSKNRSVFGRPIGQNQGIQFPIAKAHMLLESASLVRDRAAHEFDNGSTLGSWANMAKYLASEAAWEAANVAMNTFGGYGFASEFNIERKFRESRLAIVAPISNNLILSYFGEHVLGMPRSY